MKRIISSVLICILLIFPVFADSPEPAKIGVIDTGISTIAINPENIIQGKNYPYPQGSTEDKIGHGTQVASVIVGSESAKIEGICPNAKLVPLVYYSVNDKGEKVAGGTDTVAEAIIDAIDNYGCRVINISAGSNYDNPVLRNAVEYAESKGVIIVSAAGNSNLTDPDLIFYPGSYDSVVCVGSCNSDGSLASFSQVNEYVDILTLGVDVPVANIDGTRSFLAGTSFSTAIVSATVAQLIINNPKITLSEIKDVLLNTALDYQGWKILNIKDVLSYKLPISFSDVAKGSYYEKAVNWASSKSITEGTSDTTFSPEMVCSRAQIVTFLWRAAGCPGPSSAYCMFSDVEPGSYYEKAVMWAYEKGIVNGTGGLTFSPNQTCTRAQTATFIYRYCNSPVYTSVNCFTDINVDDYYYDAVLWCAQESITLGTTSTTFSPNDLCTRGQIVTFLYRAAA